LGRLETVNIESPGKGRFPTDFVEKRADN
jgi:hypothetical protein